MNEYMAGKARGLCETGLNIRERHVKHGIMAVNLGKAAAGGISLMTGFSSAKPPAALVWPPDAFTQYAGVVGNIGVARKGFSVV